MARKIHKITQAYERLTVFILYLPVDRDTSAGRSPRQTHSRPSIRLRDNQWDSLAPSYPRRSIPSCLPLTEPRVSHSNDARNNSRWFFSHMALWDEQARSMN